MNRLLLTLLLLFGTCTVAVADDLNDGIAAFQSEDYATALAKLTKAAEPGNADAQTLLASMYRKGLGVPQYYGQAAHLLKKAAEAGNQDAQYGLGGMYERGLGMTQDYQQAARWYTKAAEAGDTGAQYCLSTLYYAGKGVPMDYMQAYMWANLAASKGGEREVENREAIATFMTPAQIAEAQKLAREWKPKK